MLVKLLGAFIKVCTASQLEVYMEDIVKVIASTLSDNVPKIKRVCVLLKSLP